MFDSESFQKYLSEALAMPEPEEALGALITDAVVSGAEGKVGVLFSGGVDSTLIAFLLQKAGKPFTCYTTALVEAESEDLVWARKAASLFGFGHEIVLVNLAQLEKDLPGILRIIQRKDPVSAGVAATAYFSLKKAAEDGCTTVFTGLGSEEIFAGYERHRKAADINAECLAGLSKLFERDIERDQLLCGYFRMKAALPFLDARVIRKAMAIPGEDKMNPMEKMPLRKAAISLGLPGEFAMRKKRAAQYGSRMDWGLERLAKARKQPKSVYLAAL
ncbi:MAG: asparagine synthase C-terminal domain-containing protein [Nanoarchaeota archaeon]